MAAPLRSTPVAAGRPARARARAAAESVVLFATLARFRKCAKLRATAAPPRRHLAHLRGHPLEVVAPVPVRVELGERATPVDPRSAEGPRHGAGFAEQLASSLTSSRSGLLGIYGHHRATGMAERETRTMRPSSPMRTSTLLRRGWRRRPLIDSNFSRDLDKVIERGGAFEVLTFAIGGPTTSSRASR